MDKQVKCRNGNVTIGDTLVFGVYNSARGKPGETATITAIDPGAYSTMVKFNDGTCCSSDKLWNATKLKVDGLQ